MRLCEKGWAVAAFIPPAHTGLYLPLMKACLTHQHFHCFVILLQAGMNDKFYVPAVRIENDIRQESAGYDEEKITKRCRHIY